MTDMHGKAKMREATIAATVIRADGTREEFGVVSYWNRNPLRRFWWRFRHGKR